mmetsp:Transcript_9513/g.21143  ORF Transcript_9513/g.21143 Transcript_9513/m.21143 type:complete len:479 (-) Transcript_9513:21-1457(-)
MSKNVSLVCCFRGADKEIYTFFESIRVKASPQANRLSVPTRPVPPRVFSLPQNIWDWYVPHRIMRERDRQRPQWHVETEGDENRLHEHLAALQRLGIPTFLHEQAPNELMKLFISFEVFATEPQASPGQADDVATRTARNAFCDGFTSFVVRAMAEAVLQHFGSRCGTNLVAVFDSNGVGLTDTRWKIRLRVAFPEIAVRHMVLRAFRDCLIAVLAQKWAHEPREDWARMLDEASTESPQEFWATAVNESTTQRSTFHQLVWCDAIEGDPELPMELPLLPRALMLVSTQLNQGTVIEQVREGETLTENDWARLGSPRTPLAEPTELRDAAPMSAAPVAASAGPGAAAQQYQAESPAVPRFAASEPVRVAPPMPVALMAPQPGRTEPVRAEPARETPVIESLPCDWIRYENQGSNYYYERLTGRTVWELPPGAVAREPPQDNVWSEYRTESGQVYYHNAVTMVSAWQLPPDGRLATNGA